MADHARPHDAASTPDRSPQPTRRSSITEQASTSVADNTSREGDSLSRRPQPLRTQRAVGEFRTRSLNSPEIGPNNTVRRPLDLKRVPSRPTPHRGDTFSADDASQEVDENVAQHKLVRLNSGTSRRATSTLRRRPTSMRAPLVENVDVEEAEEQAAPGAPTDGPADPISSVEGLGTTNDDDDDVNDDNVDADDDLSDAESFTLKDRQQAINETHPFGIRIWKSALYKKKRSVEKGAEGDIHSAPGGQISRWLWIFNGGWTVIFGWWLALVAAAGCLLFRVFSFVPGCSEYGDVLWGLARYLFYPFGKYVKLIQDEAYAEEDEGEGRSISEYEQWQSGDLEEGRLFFGPVRGQNLIGRRRSDVQSEDEDETAALLSRNGGGGPRSGRDGKPKRRLFGRGQWNFGRVLFFVFFYGLLSPLLLLVSGICWLLVFSLPMGRVTLILFDHLRRHPLALQFHSDSTYTRGPGAAPSSILLCTYRAVGVKYWKYTIDGTNIFLINLLGVVAFVIFDYWVLYVACGLRIPLTNTVFVFLLALFSIIPLAYFIGQAVASISAQSTMGVGAAINAFFSTVVEVFLYCVALRQGKAQLVEGSLIGSIFAGILLLPGVSMCFGAIKRKTQRFNVKSAGVTSTMLLFATIGAFGPTLFYQIYGSHELNCQQCTEDIGDPDPLDRDCRRCFFAQIPAVHDPFYVDAVRPYIWFAAVSLFVAYMVGLLFTLRTHAATIWNTEIEEKKVEKTVALSRVPSAHGSAAKPPSIDYGTVNGGGHAVLSRQNTAGTLPRSDIRDSQLYKRILSQSLRQVGMVPGNNEISEPRNSSTAGDGEARSDQVPPHGDTGSPNQKRKPSLHVQGLSDEDSQTIIQQMAEMAATAAAVAARDATAAPRKTSAMSRTTSTSVPHQEQHSSPVQHPVHPLPALAAAEEQAIAGEAAAGGHDAPNWGRTKSYVVLLSATIAYAIIAEILVDTVDAVLANSDIDEKFLGITLFALVPNTTEFLNAISFAMNGNIALSMEIGSAYALQVCLLQIPALVLFSEINGRFIDPDDIIDHTFTLIFPQWDMVTVILCVFLLSYMYGEGKSNYFKGSILILSYLVVVVGFYFSGYNNVDVLDPNHPGQEAHRHSSLRIMGGRSPIVMY